MWIGRTPHNIVRFHVLPRPTMTMHYFSWCFYLFIHTAKCRWFALVNSLIIEPTTGGRTANEIERDTKGETTRNWMIKTMRWAVIIIGALCVIISFSMSIPSPTMQWHNLCSGITFTKKQKEKRRNERNEFNCKNVCNTNRLILPPVRAWVCSTCSHANENEIIDATQTRSAVRFIAVSSFLCFLRSPFVCVSAG